jgi:hypothetical protein
MRCALCIAAGPPFAAASSTDGSTMHPHHLGSCPSSVSLTYSLQAHVYPGLKCLYGGKSCMHQQAHLLQACVLLTTCSQGQH